MQTYFPIISATHVKNLRWVNTVQAHRFMPPLTEPFGKDLWKPLIRNVSFYSWLYLTGCSAQQPSMMHFEAQTTKPHEYF